MVTASIFGKGRIVVFSDGSTMGIFKFDGNKLISSTGMEIAFSTQEKIDAIAGAVASYVPDQTIVKFASEISKAELAEGGWKFDSVVDDAHGKYIKIVRGTGAIEVVLKA